jgi:ATP-dependent DNA helicase RecQ
MQAVGEQFTEVNLTKFLCGIYTPVFSKLKIKKLPYFGILENYPFLEVRNWIRNNVLPEKLIPGEILTADIRK